MKSKLGEIFSGVCENILQIILSSLKSVDICRQILAKNCWVQNFTNTPPLPPAAVALFREDELTEGRMNGQVWGTYQSLFETALWKYEMAYKFLRYLFLYIANELEEKKNWENPFVLWAKYIFKIT